MCDSSQCPDVYGSCTPCCSANCFARGPFPMLFTACTTVSQVRGRSPVPSSWPSHFSTSCNIQSPTFTLSLWMIFMMSGSTCRCVPKSLQRASSWGLRASITSRGQVKNGTIIIYYQSEVDKYSIYTYIRTYAWESYIRMYITLSAQRLLFQQ